MSLDYLPPAKINNCEACYGTGTQGWTTPEGEWDVTTCDVCEGKVDNHE